MSCRNDPPKEETMTAPPGRLGVYLIAALMLIAALTSFAGWSSAAPRPPQWALQGRYSPVIVPKNFVSRVDNPYFPLKPGAAFHYQGVKDNTAQTDDVVVSHQAKYVLGVRCTIVRDTVSVDGKPLERTFDWYAQDKQATSGTWARTRSSRRTAASSERATPGKRASTTPSRASSCGGIRDPATSTGRSTTPEGMRSTKPASSGRRGGCTCRRERSAACS